MNKSGKVLTFIGYLALTSFAITLVALPEKGAGYPIAVFIFAVIVLSSLVFRE